MVIETATAACSVALIAGGQIVARRHETVGRGHAERLVPMIAELPGGGRASRILVDCGPGSFTGIRVGLAAARALALGWGVPVAGFSATALVAAAALRETAAPLVVVMEGGHGEVFMEGFDASFATTDPVASLRPEAALAMLAGRPAIGSGVRWLAALAPAVATRQALPDAADAILLPAARTALAPVPLYGRAPDAKLPA